MCLQVSPDAVFARSIKELPEYNEWVVFQHLTRIQKTESFW